MSRCNCQVHPGVIDCGCDRIVSGSPFPVSDITCRDDEPCATSESCDVGSSSDPLENFPVWVKASAAFNMPACGETGEIKCSKASRFTAGAVLYNETVGKLKVVSSSDDSTLVVKNECPASNVKAPGSAIAAGTMFAVGIPGEAGSSPASSPTVPYLAADFIIPAVGQCGAAKFTTIATLSINDTVSINSLTFRIGAVLDSDTVSLCNDAGDGTPNDPILADENGDGNLDYPVLRISGENPCHTSPVMNVKRIIGCNESEGQVGFIGTVPNHVPVWNPTTQRWELKVVRELSLCVNTISELTIDPANPDTQNYLLKVSPDTAGINDLLTKLLPNPLAVDLNNDHFWVVQVVDGSTIRVRPAFDVIAIKVYPIGGTLCVLDCCSQCQPTIETVLRSGTGEFDPEEVIIEVAPTTLTFPDGVSVQTLPNGLEAIEGNAESDAHLWDHRFLNIEGCRKYYELRTNFQFGVVAPASVFVNLEHRSVKVKPDRDSFSGAAMPFIGGRGLLAGLNGSPNLLRGALDGFKTINTYKGYFEDRDFVDPGVENRFFGHIRIAVENTTGSPQDVVIAGSVRVWYGAQKWKPGTFSS